MTYAAPVSSPATPPPGTSPELTADGEWMQRFRAADALVSRQAFDRYGGKLLGHRGQCITGAELPHIGGMGYRPLEPTRRERAADFPGFVTSIWVPM